MNVTFSETPTAIGHSIRRYMLPTLIRSLVRAGALPREADPLHRVTDGRLYRDWKLSQ